MPTPITKTKKPDLTYLESASELVGKNLSSGSTIVYESTVYPGVTEEFCTPILEEKSGLKCGTDFKVGYSPERVNPGDHEHTIDKIVKIVSGSDKESLEIINSVYSKITQTHKAPSIKVAEAAKVIENIQRDLNIALMNEFSLIFRKLGIETTEVLEAAGTKWNFHKYQPGLVGGHCIGVDPYYLTYKAEELGYHPEVILAGRRINDSMHKHIAQLLIKGLNNVGKVLKDSRILIMGLTFKENVKDLRNSRVKNLIEELKSYGMNIIGCDPLLTNEEVERTFGIKNNKFDEINNSLDAVILAVRHDQFKKINLDDLKQKMDKPVLVDVKNFFNREEAAEKRFVYKSL